MLQSYYKYKELQSSYKYKELQIYVYSKNDSMAIRTTTMVE